MDTTQIEKPINKKKIATVVLGSIFLVASFFTLDTQYWYLTMPFLSLGVGIRLWGVLGFNPK